MFNRIHTYNQYLTLFGAQSTYLITLQHVYGFRIGELLKLRRENLNSEGFLYIPGSKKSSGRIIYTPELLSEAFIKGLKPKEKIFNISYNQYYRLLLRLNIHKRVPPGKKNNKVTHAFRHLRIKVNEALAREDFTTQKNFSGHLSNKGLSYYLANPESLLNVPSGKNKHPK